MVTDVTHNHPEGVKGAEAIAMGIYLARQGKSKEEIREKLSVYYPILKDKFFTIKSLCGNYGYDFAGSMYTERYRLQFSGNIRHESIQRTAI
jgi:type I restriction enzyme M protein